MLRAHSAADTTPTPLQNHLLAALPDSHRDTLIEKLEMKFMSRGDVVYESGDEELFVYFPTNSIISLLLCTENGSSSEISDVGNDGIVGLAVFMGGISTPSRAVVKSAGYAYRLGAAELQDEIDQHNSFRILLLKYTQSFITQLAQSVICNRYHNINQQLCKLLLHLLDRLDTNELLMTQEMIAHMLGVRREGVTEAAVKLQKLGVIEYSRGHITVLNRKKLEQLTCECYAIVKNETLRLQPYLVH